MFVHYARVGRMAEADAPGGGGTPPSGNGAGNPAFSQDDLINLVVGKRVKSEIKKAMDSLRGDLASVVKEAMAAQTAAVPKPGDTGAAPAPADHGDGASDRPTLKALQAQIEGLTKQLREQSTKAIESEAKARDARNRADVQQRIAAKLGADNPLLGTLIDSLYDVKKRFVEQDGRLGVKFDADGYDDWKPLDEGIGALFDGEFKHLIAGNKAKQMPPSRPPFGQRQSQPQPQANGAQAPQAPVDNPIFREVARHLSQHGENDLAALLMSPDPNAR